MAKLFIAICLVLVGVNAQAKRQLDGTYKCDDGLRVIKGACGTVHGQTFLTGFQPARDDSSILLYIWSLKWNEFALGSSCQKQSDDTTGVSAVDCATLKRQAKNYRSYIDIKSPTP
jgi:hypothetical protein